MDTHGAPQRPLAPNSNTTHHKRHWLFTGAIIFLIVVFVVFCGTLVAFQMVYKEKIVPGVRIGNVSFGGLTRGEAVEKLNELSTEFEKRGLEFSFIDETKTAHTARVETAVTAGPDGDTVDIIRINVPQTADALIAYGHTGTQLLKWGERLQALMGKSTHAAVLEAHEERIQEILTLKLARFVHEPKNAHLVITNAKTFQASIEPEQEGSVMEVGAGVTRALLQTASLTFQPVIIERRHVTPTITKARAQVALTQLPAVVGKPFVFYTASSTDTLGEEWKIEPQQFVPWLEFQEDEAGNVVIGVSQKQVVEYIEKNIVPAVEVTVQEPKFKVENDRVVEFAAARPGRTVSKETTASDFNTQVRARALSLPGARDSVAVFVATVEPKTATADVNDLGIAEVVGVGVSNYKGSPQNRIKNIRNAVKKLNGTLIAPGETFSLLEHLRPFTAEAGYLPELVIKGDRIIPEIAGGLCQIGTTVFRTSMNSGMPIIQRRNHSIVVNYYNDPTNGKPGTDATIYDPFPDFKFKNDMPTNLLLITEMDEVKKELKFSLWGTRDGRKGSYTPPEVSKWYPVGERVEIKTVDLEPGKRECQSAHPGADASFTYTVVKPDGTKEEKVFESHYRSLPETCLVGATQEEIDIENTQKAIENQTSAQANTTVEPLVE